MHISLWKNNESKRHRIITLCAVGVVINVVMSVVVRLFNIPLYLDCIGTVLTAVLGGGLPAVVVGYLSILLCSVNKTLNLYYGIPSVIFALCAAGFAKRGWLKKWWGWLVLVMCLALAGGVTSSIIGWYTFGETFNGIAAPFAFKINEYGVKPFTSQFTAELLIEIADKIISAAAACGVLHFCPKKIKAGYAREQRYGHSVSKGLTRVVIVSLALVGAMSIAIGGVYYQGLLRSSSVYYSEYVSSKAAACVDGDAVEMQFAEGETSAGYADTKRKLIELYDNQPDIRYIYVYVVNETGCYALYDVDTAEQKGQKAGSRVERDPDIYNRIDEFLAGGNVAPGYGNNPYGTMISAYTPVYDSNGKTVAYACADVNIAYYVQRMLAYIIQSAAFVFAVILATLVFMITYVNRRIINPIQIIANQTRQLEHISPEKWLDSEEWKARTPIETDDEMEELYITVSEAERNVSINVKKRMETEQELLQTREFEKINKELENMIRKADEANNAKTDFLSRMSHDMRTPMNAIIGLSALTLDDAENPEIVRDNMAKIRSSSDFLLGLVNDILDLAKIEDGSVVLNPEPYSYTEFITNMQTMFQAQCDAKNLSLILKTPAINPVISIDKMRANQIFFNIFSNAVKYTPAGGKITYTTRNCHIDGNHLAVDFIIADTGIGMSEEYQKHLFEPFVQESGEVTPELQGSGLGLSITKQLVELMGGSIAISSRKDAGTTVCIHLEAECIEKDAKAVSAQTADKNDVSILSGKHILLAEDHPLNAQIARKILEKKGVMVAHAENGRIAVEKFAASKEKSFDAILMDIRMPEMSGLDAVKAIRSMNRSDAQSVVIIAMSANAYADDVQKSLDAGMNDHLAKPVDPEKLYSTLVKYISANE